MAELVARIFTAIGYKKDDGTDWKLADFMKWGEPEPISLDQAMREWK